MDRPLRWGILGAAHIAVRRLLPAFTRSPANTVVAIASRDARRAQEVASRFNIPRVHPSYEAVLADREVDAVYNPLPNHLHGPWTERAAAAGKHVLCEKPLALNAQEAAEMVAASVRAGIVLQEAFMYRFHPQTERVRQLVLDGIVGPPQLVRATFTFTATGASNIRLDPHLGGGGLLDVGCYCASVSRLILGDPHHAFATAVYDGGVDVFLAGVLLFPHGATALLDCGLHAPYRQGCEIIGPEGMITIPRPFQPEEDPAVILIRRADREERLEIPGANQYVLLIEHFAGIVRGEHPPRFPAADAIANMRTLDALAHSARWGRVVEVPDQGTDQQNTSQERSR